MANHQQLWKVCRSPEAYLAGTDTNNHERPDCSSGCRHFHPLEGQAGMDWGVCTEPRSPRAGLLTFEHMGCIHWEMDPAVDSESTELSDLPPALRSAQ